jgi:hypothetical protein
MLMISSQLHIKYQIIKGSLQSNKGVLHMPIATNDKANSAGNKLLEELNTQQNVD